MSSFTVGGRAPLSGRLRVPGDKSMSHRALLLGALAHGTSQVRGLSAGLDVGRTRAAVDALGAAVRDVGPEIVEIEGGALHEPDAVLDAGTSMPSMRLLAGLVAGQPFLTVLTGDESTTRRPVDRVAEPLRLMGASVVARAGGTLPPLVVRGGSLSGIDYTPPVASAQVKGAVLLAGLAAEGDTVVRERVATRAHTEEMLAVCGADVRVESSGSERTVRVRRSVLRPFEMTIPGDPSQAAFWLVAATIVPGSAITVEDVYLGPARLGFVDVLRRMGAKIETDEGKRTITAAYAPLRGTEVTADELPGLVDEVPVLSVAAAVAEGSTRFCGAGELRHKETDRIDAMCTELARVGARVEGFGDGLVVHGGRLTPGRASSHGDHRVAMALAIAGLAAEGETTIDRWECVATSYPGFEADLATSTGDAP